MCCDPGAPRPPRGAKWLAGEDIALNSGVDLRDREVWPDVEYGCIDKYCKGIAVLKTMGVPIWQCKLDLEKYFNQLCRDNMEWHLGLQYIDVDIGVEIDTRGQFGMTELPGQSMRTALLLLKMAMVDLDEEQQRWEEDGGARIPTEYRA